MSYRLSRLAEQDILDIYREGRDQFGAQQADDYHTLLKQRFEFLSEHPKAARIRTELSGQIRLFPVASHLVAYTVDTQDNIMIARILHSREDWLNRNF